MIVTAASYTHRLYSERLGFTLNVPPCSAWNSDSANIIIGKFKVLASGDGIKMHLPIFVDTPILHMYIGRSISKKQSLP